jgi:hypothetical protein
MSAKFGWDWLNSFRAEDFFQISSPLFSMFSLVAIGSRDHRTQFWKGAIQGSTKVVLQLTLWEIHMKIFSSETIGPIATQLWWNDPWMAPFQNCVRWSRLPMATKLNIEKRGDEIWKKSSELAQWFLRRRFSCEFPIGSYLKLSSVVEAILVERPNRRTHF